MAEDCTKFSEGAEVDEACLPPEEGCYRQSSLSTVTSGCSSCGSSSVQTTIISGSSYSSCGSCGMCTTKSVQVPIPIATPAAAPATKDLFARLCSDLRFPDTGKVAIVKISNVYLTRGQVIYNPDIGSLYVQQVLEAVDGVYALLNKAEFGNSSDSVGQLFPIGTEFAIGSFGADISAIASATSNCISLLNDFHIPAQGTTSPAKVATLIGFSLGDKVLIRSTTNPGETYTYTLSSISGVDTLNLRNDGEGGPSGSVIKAESNDSYNYCVEPLSDVPLCTQAIESTRLVNVLGCDSDVGIQKVTGAVNNEALVWDSTLNAFTLKVIPDTTKCVSLSTCFQVVPVADVCDQLPVFFTTTDDEAILLAAEQSLLSTNAEPQITICDYPFSLDLTNSSIGSIKALPTFTSEDIISFDENCPVCIPEDCCSQCDPQSIYLSEKFFPPGKDEAAGLALPYAHLTSATEYKFSLVKALDGTQNLLRIHDNTSNGVTGSYNQSGVSIGIPNDAENRFYVKESVCNKERACPLEVQYEEDAIFRFTNIPSGVRLVVNYETFYRVYSCDKVGLDEGLLSTSKSNIVKQFVGPSIQSSIAVGSDPWGVPAPAGGAKPYDGTTGFNKRSFVLFYPTCLVVETQIYILVKVDSPPSAGDFIFGNVESTGILRAQRI